MPENNKVADPMADASDKPECPKCGCGVEERRASFGVVFYRCGAGFRATSGHYYASQQCLERQVAALTDRLAEVERLVRQCAMFTMDTDKPGDDGPAEIVALKLSDVPDFVSDRFAGLECRLAQAEAQLAAEREVSQELREACKKAATALVVFPTSAQDLIDSGEKDDREEARELWEWSRLCDTAYAAIVAALAPPAAADQQEETTDG